MPNKEKDVIINVYMETSPDRGSQQKIDRRNHVKRLKRNACSIFKTRCFRTQQGYDRRAQLIAYSQELRRCNARQIQWPFQNTAETTRDKKRIWPLAREKIRLLFSRFNWRREKWKYEGIATEDYSDTEGSRNQEKRANKKSRTKANGTRNSDFCKKLKCFLKEISSACHCKNGEC